MPLLTLNPPPGRYATQQYVDITGPSYLRIRASDTAADPLFVRTVASSAKDGTERPYVQVIDDGLGRVILDGAFTKYYNSRAAEGPNPFFANVLKYLNKRTTKRALILGDRILGEGGADAYTVKGTVASAFGTYMPNLLLENGYTYTVKDRLDYPNSQLAPSLAELNSYDVVFFFSSSNAAHVTSAVGQNFAAARKNGVGIYFCTDHGTTESSGYYVGANILLKEMADAKFLGSYDFAPGTTVGYNKTRYGDHPLFEGVADDVVIPASSSDSNVVQQAVDPVALPSVMLAKNAYTTFKFAVQNLNTGEITNETYNYYINSEPLYELELWPDGGRVDAYPVTLESSRMFMPKRKKQWYEPENGDQLVKGFVRVGNTVVASYTEIATDTVDPEGTARKYVQLFFVVLDSIYTEASNSVDGFFIKMPYWLNEDITMVASSPYNFEQTWGFARSLPGLGLQNNLPQFWEEIMKALPGLRKHISQAARLEALHAAGFTTQRPLSLPDALKHVSYCMLKNTGSYPTLTSE